MPIHKIESTDTYVRLWAASNRSIQLDYKDFDLDIQTERDRMKTALQDFFEVKQDKSTLPEDDEDKTKDPDKKYQFWRGTQLIGRSIEVTEVTWDGKEVNVKIKRITH